MKELILLRGLPGSGKSTVASLFKDYMSASADDLFTLANGEYVFDKSKLSLAHQHYKDCVRMYMQNNLNIVVHNTFTQEWEMQEYFNLAKEFDYRVHTLIVENRHNSDSIHDVPIKSINAMQGRFETQLRPDIYSKYVRIKHYKELGLYLHKYNRKVFYDNLWHLDSRLLDARGTVYDEQGNLVIYPFTKVFNYGENNTTIPDHHRVLVYRKINGFMLSATRYSGELLFASTGTLDSDFVKMGREMFPESHNYLIQEGVTTCFEIVHPDDPHIIEEVPGCYLIGIRNNSIGSKQKHELLAYSKDKIKDSSILFPESFETTFGELLEIVKSVNHEGFMVYDMESDVVLKLKSPYYLTAKFLARTKKLDLIFSKEFKKHFDEEFYDLVYWIQSTISKEGYAQISEQERLEIVRDFFGQKLGVQE